MSYPNVIERRPGRFEARHPLNQRHIHLGTYDTAEDAYRAVLIAQAEHLEDKAADYRRKAEEL